MDRTEFTKKLYETPSHIKRVYQTLSPEQVIALWVSLSLAVILTFSAIVAWNSQFLTTVPAYGGTITEGIVGTPRFINPVLATSEQDQDLTALVYTGLTKKDSSGTIILDMAESIVESEDALHYTVVIKEDARFHDGSKVTADDVIYTVNLIQNPTIKSPYRIKWEGVTMEKVSDHELIFSLKRPYPLFMDTLTIGILPRALWRNLTDEQFSLSDYNIRAIGSGPYAIEDIKTSSGIPTTITLRAHKDYTLGRPFVDTITIVSYPNERYMIQGYTEGKVSRIHGISPESVLALDPPAGAVRTSLLPRTFTVFFNPNKSSALSEKKVRQALQLAIDKQAIVETVLHNYGKVINAPFPFDEENGTSTHDMEQAKKLLSETRAFKNNPNLKITLATANTEEMRKVADMIKAHWSEIGIETTLAVYEVADLNQSVIKDRNFEALLFGSITENPADLYAFWHSSQRAYPGLNISNYVSNTLDRNLETLRTNPDPTTREEAYREVRQEFQDEVPGIFLFAPSLIYIAKDKATAALPRVSFNNSSRFTLVNDWFRYSERVWPKTYSKDVVQAVENIIH